MPRVDDQSALAEFEEGARLANLLFEDGNLVPLVPGSAESAVEKVRERLLRACSLVARLLHHLHPALPRAQKLPVQHTLRSLFEDVGVLALLHGVLAPGMEALRESLVDPRSHRPLHLGHQLLLLVHHLLPSHEGPDYRRHAPALRSHRHLLRKLLCLRSVFVPPLQAANGGPMLPVPKALARLDRCLTILRKCIQTCGELFVDPAAEAFLQLLLEFSLLHDVVNPSLERRDERLVHEAGSSLLQLLTLLDLLHRCLKPRGKGTAERLVDPFARSEAKLRTQFQRLVVHLEPPPKGSRDGGVAKPQHGTLSLCSKLLNLNDGILPLHEATRKRPVHPKLHSLPDLHGEICVFAEPLERSGELLLHPLPRRALHLLRELPLLEDRLDPGAEWSSHLDVEHATQRHHLLTRHLCPALERERAGFEDPVAEALFESRSFCLGPRHVLGPLPEALHHHLVLDLEEQPPALFPLSREMRRHLRPAAKRSAHLPVNDFRDALLHLATTLHKIKCILLPHVQRFSGSGQLPPSCRERQLLTVRLAIR
mmetsp:Transcript_8233/g.27366  ORF Transcript_8233/g.27366 Transcript_8233/m.27366 type:complete len:540 (-) Transcript_8233:11-1630(-)